MTYNRSTQSRRILFAATTLSVVLTAGASRSQQPKPKAASDAKVVVRGLRIVAEPYDDDSQMLPFNWDPGTKVVLQAHYPKGGLIDVDEKASKLAAFSDDRGTDLTKGEDRFGGSGIGGFSRFSKDGKVALVEIQGPSRPVKGANRIHASGSLVLVAATEKKTFSHKNTALQKGAQLKDGPVAFTVTKVGKPDWGDKPFQVTIETKQDIKALAEIRFFDEAGAPIESSRSSWSSMGGIGSVTVQLSYTLVKKVDVATVECDYWMDMRTVTVPFDVTASVGF